MQKNLQDIASLVYIETDDYDFYCTINNKKLNIYPNFEIREVLDFYQRKRLTADDFVWKDWHANNMIDNPIEGIYCLLFAKKGDKIYGCKWTIEYQHKESGPMCITNEIESYNLFMERFFLFLG